ncbi:MAG: hypothetical protein ACXWJK_04920 [Burkholderiaceae bacterium]
MDVASALKSEVFRPIVVILVPGLMAVTPFMIVASHLNPLLIDAMEKYQVVSVALFVAILIACGHIIEDIGSRIEVIYWERISKSTDEDNWYKYLKSDSLKDCPADGYIKYTVIRMKFESSFAVASIFSWFGYCWLYHLNIVCKTIYWWGTAALLLLAVYLTYEACAGVKLLMTLRAKL